MRRLLFLGLAACSTLDEKELAMVEVIVELTNDTEEEQNVVFSVCPERPGVNCLQRTDFLFPGQVLKHEFVWQGVDTVWLSGASSNHYLTDFQYGEYWTDMPIRLVINPDSFEAVDY